MRTFASDNYSGVCPEVMEAIQNANGGHFSGYGNDPYTEKAKALFQKEFGDDTEVFFVFTGTAANVLSLQLLTKSFHSIVCSSDSHIVIHEVGSAQKHTGCKLLTVQSPNGKISLEALQKTVDRESYWGRHGTLPKVVSITQSTEFGLVYTPKEIAAISKFCHERDMWLHMDGCRLSNAAAYLDCSFHELTRDQGVDILSFGGTKNGLMLGEAVVFFQPELSKEFEFIQKESLQLASKMRFMSAQFIPYLEDRVWFRNANHANLLTKKLAQGLCELPGVRLTHEVHTNQIFAKMPTPLFEALQKKYPFYMWDPAKEEIRLVVSFDNTLEDVQDFLQFAREA